MKSFNILKNTKKHLLFITIAAIGINACSFTEDLEDPQDLELSPINFGNGRVMGSTTKAKEKTSTWLEGNKIGIFAMLHKQGGVIIRSK